MKEKIRVLYAEDQSDDADLARRYFALNAPECDLEVVGSGEECLSRLSEGAYDALLLDNHLPDLDGVDVLTELARRNVGIPVVMVTGVGDEDLVVQVLRLGAWDYVPKQGNYLQTLPVVLKNAVSAYRAQRERGQQIQPRQRRILYVEHDPYDIDLTVRHFNEVAPEYGIEVAESFERARALLEGGAFAAVLADLRMPDMSALTFLKEARHSGLDVPIVIVTGKGDESAAVATLKLGAADYIVKREGYLTQLPHSIANAITRTELAEANRRLSGELAERQRAEAENLRLLAEMQSQRQRIAEIIASVEGVVWETRGAPGAPDQRMEFISDYVEQMFGYSVQEWLSKPGFWTSILHPEDRDRVLKEARKFFVSSKGGSSQFRSFAADGRVVWIDARSTVILDQSGKPVGMRGVAVDITAQKEAERTKLELEEELQQARKMESIGRLAGGVAHDFNNLLTVINGYAHIMEEELQPGEPLRTPLTEIRRAGERAADLTRQLLAFSRKQLLRPRILDLNSLIGENTQMLRRLLGDEIELATILDPGLGTVKADGSQMSQVIVNLVVNARDVMPRGGCVTLETRNVVLGEGSEQKRLGLQPGPYIMLAVRDVGSGMDSETLSHVFEPFFTTKDVGKGTGLGLSTVYGIVKQSGGSVSVDSEPGRGTSIEIYLPRVDKPSPEIAPETTGPEAPQGSEAILVVEDEDAVRSLISRVLRNHGYEVMEAASGQEALGICERRRGSIRLVISDVVMPHMSGRELAGKLQQLDSGIQILYISGYTDDAIVRHGLQQHSVAFLPKPFTPSELAWKVRSLLDKQAGWSG